MSKSLKRVTRHLVELGLECEIEEVGPAKTAQAAANAKGVKVDQIAKSIIFAGATSGDIFVFLTAGGNRVDADKASKVAGEPMAKADAALIRKKTGFAIGGVSPFGHLTPSRMFIDPDLMAFDMVYAAAGTPNHVFGISPQVLQKTTGAEIQAFCEKM